MRRLVIGVGLFVAPVVHAQERVEAVQPVNPGGGQSSQARAQVSGDARLTFQRQIEIDLGPFLVRPGIGASTGARAVTSVANSGGFRLGTQVFFEAGPRLDILLPLGSKHLFSATSDARYRWSTTGNTNENARTGPENRWFYSATGGYQFTAQRLQAALTYSASRRETGYLANLTEGDSIEQTETLAQRDVTQRGPGARVAIEFTNRLNLTVAGDRIRETHEDTGEVSEDLPGFGDASDLDRERTTIDAVLDRRMTGRITIGLFANGRRSEYLEDVTRNDRRLRGGFQFTLAGGQRVGTLSGRLRVGVEDRDLEDPTRDGFTGPYAQGTVAWVASRNVRVNFVVAVQTQATTWANNTYFVQTEGGAIVDLALLRRFGIYVGGRYGTLRYPEPASVEIPDEPLFTGKREDSRWTAEGGITFFLFRQPVRLGGGYFQRSSNFALAENTGWFVRFNFSGSIGVRESI